MPASTEHTDSATRAEPPVRAGNYVNFDEYVERLVQKTSAGIRASDLIAAFSVAIAGIALYTLLFVLADHWMFEGGVPPRWRTIGFRVVAVAAVAWFVIRLAAPVRRQVTSLFAAQQLEKLRPDLKQSLVTLIDLKSSTRPSSPAVRRALEKRTALTLKEMNTDHAVDRRLAMRSAFAALGIVAVMCLYAVLSPKSLGASVVRALVPFAGIEAPTRTRIESVTPGDAEVFARSTLAVECELSGDPPEDGVRLRYTTADRQMVDAVVKMSQPDPQTPIYRGTLHGVRGKGLMQDVTYRVEAGDDVTQTFTVAVSQPPSATVKAISYEYPAYMRRPDRTDPPGRVEGVEGTRVRFEATSNVPVRRAELLLGDDVTLEGGERVTLRVQGGREISGDLRLRLREDGSSPTHWAIQVATEDGKEDPRPTVYPMSVTADLPPVLSLRFPVGEIERPVNGSVAVAYEVTDPDFQLRDVQLMVQKDGSDLARSPVLFAAPPQRPSVRSTYMLDLNDYRLQVGDELTLYLTARDNFEPFADRLENRTNSPKATVRIVEPVTPQQAGEPSIGRRPRAVAATLKQSPYVNAGTVNPDIVLGKPYVEFGVDRTRAARYGMTVRGVNQIVAAGLGGVDVTTTVEGRERYPIQVRYRRDLRERVDRLGEIPVVTSTGNVVPLSRLADVTTTWGPGVISSEDSRLVTHELFRPCGL